MPKVPLLEHIQMHLRVPRGHEGYWAIITDLGAEGRTFTAADVDSRSNVDRRSIADYLKRLLKAGHLVVAETVPLNGGGAAVRHHYRLGRPSREAPRLRRDGTAYPETARDRMWRAMKMLDHWTSAELAEATATDTLEPVGRETVKSYVKHLHAADVVQIVDPGGPFRPAVYRLLRNIGASAPRILRTHVVFDPNSNTVIGAAQAEEVA